MDIKYKQEEIVNLRDVSNIYINLQDNGTGRVIFNIDRGFEIFGNDFISSYIYWNFSTEEELKAIKDIFEPKVKDLQWDIPEEGRSYVNPKSSSNANLGAYNEDWLFDI